MNAWDDRLELIKAQPLALTSGRDKKPFEVTRFSHAPAALIGKIPAARWANADSTAMAQAPALWGQACGQHVDNPPFGGCRFPPPLQDDVTEPR